MFRKYFPTKKSGTAKEKRKSRAEKLKRKQLGQESNKSAAAMADPAGQKGNLNGCQGSFGGWTERGGDEAKRKKTVEAEERQNQPRGLEESSGPLTYLVRASEEAALSVRASAGMEETAPPVSQQEPRGE